MNIIEFENRLVDESIKSSYILPLSLKKCIRNASKSSRGLERKVLVKIVENIEIAESHKIPLCQDTGVFEVWLKIGKYCVIKDANFNTVVRRAIKKAHEKGKLRASMNRIEPVVHIDFTEAKKYIEVVITPRGFGSENYSFLHMMNPESSFSDIEKQVLEDVKYANGAPCPPYIVGVGIGGTASKAVEMSTKALTEVKFKGCMEKEVELLKEINTINTGAGGFGGKFTALGVKIKYFPRHIAGLSVGVHIGCWCNRVRRFKFETS